MVFPRNPGFGRCYVRVRSMLFNVSTSRNPISHPPKPNRNSAAATKKTLLRDPGAVSRAGRKGTTKVVKHRRKSHWVPTFTEPFPNGQANAGSWLGTKNALYYCAQSANSFSWVLFVSSYTTTIDWSRPRLVRLMHQKMHAVRNLSVWYKRYISKYW